MEFVEGGGGRYTVDCLWVGGGFFCVYGKCCKNEENLFKI